MGEHKVQWGGLVRRFSEQVGNTLRDKIARAATARLPYSFLCSPIGTEEEFLVAESQLLPRRAASSEFFELQSYVGRKSPPEPEAAPSSVSLPPGKCLRASQRPSSSLLCAYHWANGSPISEMTAEDSKNSPIGEHIAGDKEVTMDLKDRRLWYGVAVIVVLIVIAYAAGWFGGTPTPVPPQ
jgi:hypothetical protein